MPQSEARATYRDWEDRVWSDWVGLSRTASGQNVNSRTALTVAAYFACIRNISEDVAKLPRSLRRRLARGSEYVPGHPVQTLLDYPNEDMDAHTFFQTLMAHAVSGLDGYAEIIWQNGYPVAMFPLDPTSVTPMRNKFGNIVYHISGMNPREGMLPKNILHIHGVGWDGTQGYNIAQLAKEILGAGQALQSFRGSFFGNGLNPQGVLEFPGKLPKESGQRLREQFEERYAGGENAHRTMLLEEGMKWTPISIDPERAQMEAATHITGEDILRYFRMPPHKAGFLNRSTFSNIEHQAIEYGTDTVDPWRDKLRRELERKLIIPSDRLDGIYIDINLKALMRGDSAARAAFYKELYYMGALSANEIREYEDENPIDSPNGDRYFVQQNLIPLDRVDDAIDKNTKPAPVAPAAPTEDDPEDDAMQRVRESYEYILGERIQNNFLRIERDRMEKGKADPHFYDGQEKFIAQHLEPFIRACSRAFALTSNAEQIARDYAHTHVGVSQSNIDNNDLSTWTDGTRAVTAARNIVAAVVAASSKEESHAQNGR